MLKKKQIFIIGSNARLAKAIVAFYKTENIILVEREIYENWGEDQHLNSIYDYFNKQLKLDTIIFITSGILDSNTSITKLEKVNFHLPWNIIKSLEATNIKIITFGTILEKIKGIENFYVKSKLKLSCKINTLQNRNVLHIRLHTMYGYGLPSSFMFLGQILTSLKHRSVFNMSSGVQIREYHHLDDVAKSIDILVEKDITGITEITSGTGIDLRSLAQGIFKYFELENLLKIGIKRIDQKEKLENNYKKNEFLKEVDFRHPIIGINSYLEKFL